jgi:arylsulfatase A-like enzyme
MMDELFGRVLGKLRELGLEENTLVIYTSDHGDMQGAHAMMGKYVDAYYDEIVRVPLIVRYPPSIRAGKTLEQHASSVDVMPTILDYLGLPLPPSVQGQSLRDQLDGKVAPDDRPAFGERGIDGINASRMIRTREWKYSIFGSGRRELFHLAEDPNELRNLIEDPSYEAQRKGLEQQLRQWMVANKDPALDGLL